MSNPPPPVDLSVIIPAFNEEHRIEPTLERLHAQLSARSTSYEILVVDDQDRVPATQPR
jgi:dolichyl-phosphate beta-glucosyltransferase